MLSLTRERYRRDRFRLVSIYFAILIPFVHIYVSANIAAGDEVDQPLTQLRYLSNAELTQKAKTTLEKFSQKYMAEIRGKKMTAIFLKQAREESKPVIFPERKIVHPAGGLSSAEWARNSLNYAKNRLKVFQDNFENIQNEKSLLENHIKQLANVREATQLFIDAIQNLRPFLLEIKLRLNDGTISIQQIPKALNSKRLQHKRDILLTELEHLTEEITQANDALKDIVKTTKKAKKSVIESQALYSSAQARYSQEIEWRKLESEFAQKTPKQLLSQFSTMKKEQVWLNGSYTVSFR